MATRTVFFGTPDFAVPTLEALVASGRKPALVITQQARRAGRGGRLRQPPVAMAAESLDLPIEQPATLRNKAFQAKLRDLEPDVAIVVAFGKIFGRRLLRLPKWGCLNVHASLLPLRRGAAPIQAAILAGDTVTGVTIMRMEEGLDSGPILLQRELAIGAGETYSELGPRLAGLGAETMLEALEGLEEGRSEPVGQLDELATYSAKITKLDGVADWGLTADELFCRWRAFHPWPGLTAVLRDRPLKLLEVELVTGERRAARAGEILGLDSRRERLEVGCGARGDTILGLRVVQRPGRRPVRAVDLFHGEQLVPGELFSRERH